MPITGMSHFTVLTEDLEATRHFYCDLLGLAEGERPAFGFPGLWLYRGGSPILHIVAGRPLPEERAGVIDHIAFDATDLQTMVDTLRQAQIHFRLNRLAGGAQNPWQLFCLDPNGARVELDFPASEAAPAGFA